MSVGTPAQRVDATPPATQPSTNGRLDTETLQVKIGGQLKQVLRDLGYKVRDPVGLVLREHDHEGLPAHAGRRRVPCQPLARGGPGPLPPGAREARVRPPVLLARLQPYIILTLALEVMFVVGWYIMRQAFASARRRILNQHVLMELSAFGGLLGGLRGMFVAPRFPAMDFIAVSPRTASDNGPSGLFDAEHHVDDVP